MNGGALKPAAKPVAKTGAKPVAKPVAKPGATPAKPGGTTRSTFTVALDPAKGKPAAAKFKIPGATKVVPKNVPDTPSGGPAGAPAGSTTTFKIGVDPKQGKPPASKFRVTGYTVKATNIPDTPGAATPANAVNPAGAPAPGAAATGTAAPAPIGSPDPPGTTSQTLSDGTVQKTQPDGTIREEMPDGTIRETSPDGTVRTIDADGNITVVDAEGNPIDVSQNSTSYDESGNPIASASTGLTSKGARIISPGMGEGIQTTLPKEDYSRVYEYIAVPEGVDLDALDNDFSEDSVAHIANDTLYFGCVRVAGRLICATGAGGALDRKTASETIRKKLAVAIAGLGNTGQNVATMTPAESNKQAMLISASVEAQLASIANTLRTKTAGYTPTCSMVPDATKGTCRANTEKLTAAMAGINEAQSSLSRIGSASGGSRRKRKHAPRSARRRHRR